jgi:Protein of unknown function (DUF3618)
MTEPEIRQEIERTREQLGATVEELAARADVPARMRSKAAETREMAQAKAAAASGRIRGTATRLSRRAQPGQLAGHRWPLALAVGLIVVGGVAVWRWRKA